MDDLALRLYLCRVEEKLLLYAAEARDLRREVDHLQLVDEPMARQRAQALLGLGVFRQDDLRVLYPSSRVGRLLTWTGRALIRLARAIG